MSKYFCDECGHGVDAHGDNGCKLCNCPFQRGPLGIDLIIDPEPPEWRNLTPDELKQIDIIAIGVVERERDEARRWARRLLKERNEALRELEICYHLLPGYSWPIRDSQPGLCLKCGSQTQQVRPGKWQCTRCE